MSYIFRCEKSAQRYTSLHREILMLVNKTKAARLAGVSRRTFYNHIPEKRISVSRDGEGNELIETSELERIYGKEVVQRNLKDFEDVQQNVGNSVHAAHGFTPQSVKFEALILEERLRSAETLIEQLKSERSLLLEDKERAQEQLDKALAIGAPIGKLLTDQRDFNEGRAVIERKVIKEGLKREAAEKKIQSMAKKIKELQMENQILHNKSFWKRLFG